MWSMLHTVFATYNGTTYSLTDFVNALSPSNPHYIAALAVAGLTFAIGFIEYIYSFLLVNREKKSPYNVLMHTFYFAIDSMGIFVFALASHATGGFWVFTAASIAEVVWTLFEIYNLVLCIYVERVDIWGSAVTVAQAWWKVLGWLLVMIPTVNLFRVFMNDPAMLKWYIFTNILMGIMPGLYWEKRGTRLGASWGLAIVICVGTINSFLLTNMWATISSYFSIQNNPWFYVVGVVAIFFSIRAFWVLHKLPAKPKTMPNGKKTIW
ncbi:hypothetical protein AYR62_01450 [Secundilactobacillus paracollinoides]|uniref:Uncharacterized protein n=1 Tax=Secundilactobacillus paracollinoides TaxID=240427 RepID=A0A1B2IV53_9LACO|nr:hypothetical protein [Secundilactobacillus paracollinoides]ANZ60150.1 hypothetical protein AYR61_01480 [Secundilactobacillus paracollinoides]ANZ62897.1 hypothetical protein AYR62_01450 [Secundilactobacillus paracollinoides]ANZ65944.1 hypothetical protein AYR63_01500 [Secundilactobacillus paracollinoides]KRL78414.1 hypothetical protein FC17_GL001002 [Secundilactobacillus paracollinoides DSM 15502 = JCM 11969]